MADAPNYIAGYTIANDFGLHDFRDTDAGSMLRVKGADTLAPSGPGLVTDWDFHYKSMRTRVNGVIRQDGSTEEMAWDMHYLVTDVARLITLVPGDVILSGTPAYSRPVEPGDVVTVEVEGLGALTNHVVAAPEAVSDEVGRAAHAERRSIIDGAWAATGSFGVNAARSPPIVSPPLPQRPPEVRVMSEERTNVGILQVATGHFINNERVSSPTTFEDRSPLDWSLKLADVSRGTTHEADLALSAPPKTPFPPGPRSASRNEVTILRRLADLIDDNVERIASVETSTWPCWKRVFDCASLVAARETFAPTPILAEHYEPRRWASNGTHNTVLRMPAGPTVVITPWNAPFMLSTWKCAPALAAGNTVVLKPAEWSPLSCSLLMDLVLEAEFPPGVFNLVQGIGDEVGAALVADPRVRRISFTGSPETGSPHRDDRREKPRSLHRRTRRERALRGVCRRRPGPGGRKAALMYDDAGQVCLAGTRLIVRREHSR